MTTSRRRLIVPVIALSLLMTSGCSLASKPLPSTAFRGSTRAEETSAPVPLPTPDPTPATVDGVSIPSYWHALPTSPSGVGITPYARLGSPTDFARAVGRASETTIGLPPGVFSFADFHPTGGTMNGAVLGPEARGLIGSGANRSTIEMRPGTSTRAHMIPTRFPDTNQLSLLRVSGPGVVVSGFTLLATQQGHLYNGMRIDRSQRPVVRDIRVLGVPGDSSSPPGETFGVNDYLTSGATYTRLEVDGAGVGASGFGSNDSNDVSLRYCFFHGNRYSMGATFWQVRDVSVVDSIAVDNGRAGFNFERVSGAVRLVRPVTAGNGVDFSIASDQSSARYTIVDPVHTGAHVVIRIPPAYYGHPERQRAGDVRIIVRGQDVTAQVARFVAH